MTALIVRERPADYVAGALAREEAFHEPSLATGKLTEADLVRLWAGQRFPAAALVTRHGVPLRVLHPGRRGRGAGPDMRDAIIAPPSGRLLRGDVELHVRASDFIAHGHANDHRYDRVILHLVFDDDTRTDTRLASGRSVPVVALAPWLRRRAGEIASWLATPRLWREPCHDAVTRLGTDRVALVLEALGDERFRQREAAVTEQASSLGPGEALYRALLEALSYGSDRSLFASIAKRLPWSELASRLQAVPAKEGVALAEALLLEAAGPGSGSTLPPTGGRPANHPARRLTGAAKLFVRHHPARDGLAVKLDLPVPRLIADWSVAGVHGRSGSLIGRGRAIELLVNAVLPWVAVQSTLAGDGARAALAREVFARLPRPGAYGALTFLENNVRGSDRLPRIDARRHQGLLALYKTECTQGGCGRCPFS